MSALLFFHIFYHIKFVHLHRNTSLPDIFCVSHNAQIPHTWCPELTHLLIIIINITVSFAPPIVSHAL